MTEEYCDECKEECELYGTFYGKSVCEDCHNELHESGLNEPD